MDPRSFRRELAKESARMRVRPSKAGLRRRWVAAGDVLTLDRAANVEAHPLEEDDHRPPALGREPCTYCGTRGDLGCAHFSPFEEPGRERVIAAQRRGVRQLDRHGHHFEQEEDGLILQLTEQGHGTAEIGERLGRTRASIAYRLLLLRREQVPA
jgi:hypothetical protein